LDSIILFGLLAVLIVFMFRNNKKRKQQADELQASIAVGANVMLTSGIYGRVTKIDGDRLVIETTPGTSLSVIKLAVREVIKTDVESPVTKTTKKAEKPAVASSAEPVKKTTVKKTAK
jgi:preprotein translocase subunit YajC